MNDILNDMVALEAAAKRCIPLLASDPVLLKCNFDTTAIIFLDVEYDQPTDRKLVVLKQCGLLSTYLAQILRELLIDEESIDAWVTFGY